MASADDIRPGDLDWAAARVIEPAGSHPDAVEIKLPLGKHFEEVLRVVPLQVTEVADVRHGETIMASAQVPVAMRGLRWVLVQDDDCVREVPASG